MTSRKHPNTVWYSFLFYILSMVVFVLSFAAEGWAGEVRIVDATVVAVGADSFRFDVTLQHDDSGWDHYADRWEVLAPDGAVIATRVLHHPHVEEQPFTRSLGGVVISQAISSVRIRAHDKVHGYGEQLFDLTLPGR